MTGVPVAVGDVDVSLGEGVVGVGSEGLGEPEATVSAGAGTSPWLDSPNPVHAAARARAGTTSVVAPIRVMRFMMLFLDRRDGVALGSLCSLRSVDVDDRVGAARAETKEPPMHLIMEVSAVERTDHNRAS